MATSSTLPTSHEPRNPGARAHGSVPYLAQEGTETGGPVRQPASQTPTGKCTPGGPHRSAPHALPCLPGPGLVGVQQPFVMETLPSPACAARQLSGRPSGPGVPTRSGPTSDNGIVTRELWPWVSLSISSFKRSKRKLGKLSADHGRQHIERTGLCEEVTGAEPGPVGPARRRKSPP